MKGLLKVKTLNIILLFVFAIVAVQPMYAVTKPRWVTHGTKELNKQRSNTSYEFVSLNSHDLDINWLKDNKLIPLKEYIVKHFNAIGPSIDVYTVSKSPEEIYKVVYKGQDGKDYIVEAKLVDEFQYFDDFELNVYEYEYYQLYAVSMPNTNPLFDQFKVTEAYEGISKTLSFIPGASQLYKGQKTEGYVIIGGEVFFLGAALYFDGQRREAHKNYMNNVFPVSSWRSKDRSWRNFEIGAFACAGALYIYNVINGMTAKGQRHVNVKKTKHRYIYSFAPYIDVDHTGMSFVVNF